MTGIALLFASGFTALAYEVLWLRQLGLVFGNTASSAATCLAIFFLGMAAGQMTAARFSGSLRRPLAAYGVLELLAAATTLGALALPSFYTAIYRGLFDAMTDSAGFGLAVRLALSAVVLLPPAVLLGATLPVMVEAEAVDSGATARVATGLYAANTLGGVVGALLASFVLAPTFGSLASYLLVAALNVAIGVTAIAIGSKSPAREPASETASVDFDRSRPPVEIAALAFASGLLALAMEVVWTRMLVQVLHNSVYSFALVLAVMLVALGAGALLVHLTLARRARLSPTTLTALMGAAGVATVLSASVFEVWTDGLAYLGGAADWGIYIAEVLGLAVAVMLVPGTLLGMVFPALIVLSARREAGPGAAVGRLVALNTVGAVCGSLIAGFVLLPHLGLWTSLLAIALAYLLVGPLVFRDPRAAGMAAACALVLVVSPANPTRLRHVDVDPRRDQVLSVEDSAEGTVSVVRRGEVVSIKLNNSYTVGTNANVVNDRRKADLPLMLVPEADSVFFLGMGAGITASAALAHPVREVVTVELVPAIARAAESYLEEHTRRLFNDPRSRVIFGDGRTWLAATDATFDVVVGDLFVPWHSGTGNLYTVEHFEEVKRHLNDGGVFAQWLPMYQLTEAELAIVARTMLEVFPLVTMWRGDLKPTGPSVALFGHQKAAPIDLSVVLENVRLRIGEHGSPDAVSEALMLLFYAGNLTRARALFADEPLNTQDRPIIEYRAPIAQRRVKAGEDTWLIGGALVDFYRRVAAAGVADDEFLAGLSETQRGYAVAGLDLYESFVRRTEGDAHEAERLFASFARRAPREVVAMFESMMARPTH